MVAGWRDEPAPPQPEPTGEVAVDPLDDDLPTSEPQGETPLPENGVESEQIAVDVTGARHASSLAAPTTGA